MDLRTALKVVGTPLTYPGTSDSALVEKLRPELSADSDWIRSARRLHGHATIRPADLLRALAVATRPRYERDVHDVYAAWALLRYIGIFDAGVSGECRLSTAGRRILGNQRRVLSEEIGIGMSATLAGLWMGPNSDGTVGAVELIDVDVLVESDPTWLSPSRSTAKRPDYLIMKKMGDRVRIGFLECKGSKASSNRLRQLATAFEQLGGLLVGGRPVRGLAVAATVADGGVRYSAIERTPPILDKEGNRLRVAEVPSGWVDELLSGPESDQFSVPEFRSSADVREIARRSASGAGAEASVAAVLAESWSIVSDLAANEDGVERWSDRKRRGRTEEGRRQRSEFTQGEMRVRGTANSLALPGGQLEAILGVLDYVDDALIGGSSTDIIAAQARAQSEARRLSESSHLGIRDGEPPTDVELGDDPVTAVGPDGTVLVLRQRS